MNFLTVYQIYFHEEQKKLLESGYKHFLNSDCTEYFENSVIANLITDGAHKNSAYFGVVSYKLAEKVESCRRGPRANVKHFCSLRAEQELKNEFMKAVPDVMGFLQYTPHDPVRYFQNIHPDLPRHFETVLNKLGYEWTPGSLKNVFYSNYFVARNDVYERYVKEILLPAMAIMQEMPELKGNSGYPKKLPEDLQKKFGYNWYPHHSFICERLFSWFANYHNLNCVYY